MGTRNTAISVPAGNRAPIPWSSMPKVIVLTYSNELVKINVGKRNRYKTFCIPKTVVSAPRVSDKRTHMLHRHTNCFF